MSAVKMYCLSQFCCFCFRNKVKLKLLHQITCNNTTFLNMATTVLPEIQLFGIRNVVSICEDCVDCVMEMYEFCNTCIKNNRLLVEYVEQLRSFGGKIGNVQVQLLKGVKNIDSDNKMEWDVQGVTQEVNCEVSKLSDIKIEAEELPEEQSAPTLESTSPDCDGTSVSEGDYPQENFVIEDVNIKIEEDFSNNFEYVKSENLFMSSFGEFSESTDAVEARKGVENLKQHDFQERPYDCVTCGKSFVSLRKLKLHSAIHTDKERYKCDFCGKFFSRMWSMKEHRIIHTGEKPHKCETCGKCFAQSASLRNHLFTHAKEKPYKCLICEKTFAQVSSLTYHTHYHTGHKPYKCDLCGKSFSKSYSYKTHMMDHAGEKPHKCGTCGKCFSRLPHLKSHEAIHKEEKPHKCEVCGKCYTTVGCLRRHFMAHTDEKPYKCNICEKSFTVADNLRVHYMIHTGEKPHRCEICGKGFSLSSYLKKHCLAKHSEKP